MKKDLVLFLLFVTILSCAKDSFQLKIENPSKSSSKNNTQSTVKKIKIALDKKEYLLPFTTPNSTIKEITPIVISGTPVSYSLSGDSLPTGLSFNSTTGIISGSPSITVLTARDFTLTATNSSGGSAVTTFKIKVIPAFVVNSTNDFVDTTLNGICDSDNAAIGDCTLRAAFAEAVDQLNNQGASEFLIRLPEGHYKLNIANSNLTAATTVASDKLYLQGDSRKNTFIDLNHEALKLSLGNGTFDFSHFKLENGRNTDSHGGGATIGSGAQVSFSDCEISNNELRAATIDSRGGGVYVTNTSTLNAFRCVFLNNKTINSGGGCSSGGGFFINSSSTINIYDSYLSGNIACANGGGIGGNSNANIEAINNTFSYNTGARGSAITATGAAAVINISNNTFAFNRNSSTSVRGVIYSNSAGTNTVLNNNVFYGNVRVNGESATACSSGATGNYTVSNNNFSDETAASDCSGTPSLSINPQLNTTLQIPQLGTPYYSLSLTSPAINAASDADCLALDQRGKPRIDLAAINGGSTTCDAGAIEVQSINKPSAPNYKRTWIAALINEPLMQGSFVPVMKDSGEFHFSVTPSLPAGLSLNKTTGEISGTPVELQTDFLQKYTITASNDAGSATSELKIYINNGYKVDTLIDAPHVGGGCIDTNGDCSISAAITELNANNGGVILVPSGTYTLSSRLPNITAPIFMVGQNKDNTIVQAAAAPSTAGYRVFRIDLVDRQQGGFSDLTIRHGQEIDNGGGIIIITGTSFWGSNLIIDQNETTQDNNSNYGGGGVYVNSDNEVNFEYTVFSNNTAFARGGAFRDHDFTGLSKNTFSHVIFKNNQADQMGGAIYLSAVTNISRNLFEGNFSNIRAIINTYKNLNINDSTFYNNSFNNQFTGIIDIQTSGVTSVLSFFGNTVVSNNPPVGSSVILASTSTSELRLGNNIFYGNTTGNGICDGAFGNMYSYGGNITDEPLTECGFSGPMDLSTATPGIIAGAPISNNGEFVPTVGLSSGSVAIDFGTNRGCSTNQASLPASTPSRALDGDSDNESKCDSGSFEYGL